MVHVCAALLLSSGVHHKQSMQTGFQAHTLVKHFDPTFIQVMMMTMACTMIHQCKSHFIPQSLIHSGLYSQHDKKCNTGTSST
jgi:hypothetical protein